MNSGQWTVNSTQFVVNAKVMMGKPVIRGLRITVEQILLALAAGATVDELMGDYPELELEDFSAVLLYAASNSQFGNRHRLKPTANKPKPVKTG